MKNVESAPNAQKKWAAAIGTTPKRPIDIAARTFSFGVRTFKMTRALPKDFASQVVVRQLARSGMSIGANVEEAQASQSKVDFARRMNIALNEARESHYWLRLIRETKLVPAPRLDSIIDEANELVSILTTIVKKSRSGIESMRRLRA
ncbi:MAG TPA: four helix bundle protein [Phycisphaerae bacterium]|nr:four helix bundle protein [Phycisphaerae bacterium]